MDQTCSVTNCSKLIFRRDWCSMHYSRLMRYGDLNAVHKPGNPRSLGTCRVDNCNRDSIARDLCDKHYQRWAKFGDPLVVKVDREQTFEERFWLRVNKNGPCSDYAPHLGSCWIWTGTVSNGYGVISRNNRPEKAHILSYTWEYGEIPDGWERDHLCHVTVCIRPDHLEAVPPRINKIRGNGFSGINARKTQCPKGHPYDDSNTYVDPKGSRICRECARQANRDWYYRQKVKRLCPAGRLPPGGRCTATSASSSSSSATGRPRSPRARCRTPIQEEEAAVPSRCPGRSRRFLPGRSQRRPLRDGGEAPRPRTRPG